MSDALTLAGDSFRANGFSAVDVPVLLPMEDFVRISGEEFRRRIFVTSSNRGDDWCLRPEFTIPVVRATLKTDPDGGKFCYSGRIFRNGRPGEADEVWQAGGEIIGAHDTVATDAAILAQALTLAADCGVQSPKVIVGDVALFTALLEALDIPPAWRTRLATLFGDPAKIADTLDRMEQRRFGFPGFAAHAEIIEALSRFPADKVGQLFADILSIAGVQTVGGRTTGEIAERVLEQAMLASSNGLAEDSLAAIRAFMSMHDGDHGDLPIREGAAQLKALSARIDHAAPFAAAVERFVGRLSALEAAGVDLDRLTYAAGFGRRLGYYDGFVFDLIDEANAAVGQVIGGGRYDGLLRHFGAKPGLKAIGFAVWTERFQGVGA
ncbi:ATP phosphoribosyltransferase regulatory subunit [Oryzibacter oryziterrae]|uniref:ATP phosphoribosyltransferase regulatory subunit n=1 Tax=Oryzibacter oryziterrae TaxID=2766474 RepID=UPI001F483883|nr:ATP phosphoribosyltransferase regulatory subunit [Oryzibacter oryziterrae]